MKIFINKLLTIFFVFLSINSACYGDEKIKIGLIVPLTGIHADLGNSIVNSIRLALNKINDPLIEILPRDTKSNPIDTLEVSKKLYKEGVRIIIGPIFNSSSEYLDQLDEVKFLSFTNKILNNPKNVISLGVNAVSQISTIKRFQKEYNLQNSIFLIPDSEFKFEIEKAINKTNINLKSKFIYNTDPTILTSQIEKLTFYQRRRQNLIDEIKRIENSNLQNKKNRIANLEKRDTLGGINFDSVIIADFDERLKSVATSLLYTDVSSKRIKYICLNQWFDETLLKEKNLQPIYFPSVNKDNYDLFKNEYFNIYGKYPNQISFLSYDALGLVYFLLYKNDFKISDKLFFKKNKFKGKIGIFEINKNKVTHKLNLYSVDNERFIKIF